MHSIPKATILPTDTLLVGFDFTHGDDHKVLIVGKKRRQNADDCQCIRR